MRPFKRIRSIRFFRTMSRLFVVSLLILLLLNKFQGPVDFWLFITAFVSIPFLGVMFWIDRVRLADGDFSIYFALFLFSIGCSVVFGWVVTAEYLTLYGQSLIAAMQIIFSALVYMRTEKFGRNIGGPPIRTKSTLRFY
ncbi:MAG: hypothetical protein WCN88_00495 [Candidatus Falkowbacteria bacterium]